MYRIIYRYFGERKISIVTLDRIGAKNMVINDYDIEILDVKKF